MGKGEFYNEIDQMVKDLIEQDKKRIKQAFEKIKKEVAKEIQMIIQRDMIDNYYNGYEPLVYNRTFQLSKSVAPLILDSSVGDTFQFDVGIKLKGGEKKMSHNTLTVTVKGRTYTYRNNGVDEGIIFNNFLEGIHPNANPKGVTSTPTTHVRNTAEAAIDNLFTDGIIDKIVNDVFSK